jgi:hypothetical protein
MEPAVINMLLKQLSQIAKPRFSVARVMASTCMPVIEVLEILAMAHVWYQYNMK